MKKNELIEFLQRQIEFLQGRLDEALTSVNSLTLANEKLVATVDELRKQIASLEDVIKLQDLFGGFETVFPNPVVKKFAFRSLIFNSERIFRFGSC